MINTINNYLYFYVVMFALVSLTLEPTLLRAAMEWPYLDRGTGDEDGQDESAYENMQSRDWKTGNRCQ